MKGNSVLNTIRARGPAMQAVPLVCDRYALPVLPSGVGYDRVADTTYRWHGLMRGDTPFVIAQHTLSGEGWLRFEGRRYRLTAGDCMLVSVPHDHCYWWEPPHTWEFVYMSLHGPEAMRLARLLASERGPVICPGHDALAALADGVGRLLTSPLPAPGMASSMAYRLLMAMHDDAPSVADHASAGPPAGITKALEHLQAALHTEPPDAERLAGLDVPTLARIAGLSRAHFSRRFGRAVGMAPGKYLMLARIRRAAELLARRDASVKAVALSLGFHDPNYFAKAFRRTFGLSPREFRSSGMYLDTRRQPGNH